MIRHFACILNDSSDLQSSAEEQSVAEISQPNQSNQSIGHDIGSESFVSSDESSNEISSESDDQKCPTPSPEPMNQSMMFSVVSI